MMTVTPSHVMSDAPLKICMIISFCICVDRPEIVVSVPVMISSSNPNYSRVAVDCTINLQHIFFTKLVG